MKEQRQRGQERTIFRQVRPGPSARSRVPSIRQQFKPPQRQPLLVLVRQINASAREEAQTVFGLRWHSDAEVPRARSARNALGRASLLRTVDQARPYQRDLRPCEDRI